MKQREVTVESHLICTPTPSWSHRPLYGMFKKLKSLIFDDNESRMPPLLTYETGGVPTSNQQLTWEVTSVTCDSIADALPRIVVCDSVLQWVAALLQPPHSRLYVMKSFDAASPSTSSSLDASSSNHGASGDTERHIVRETYALRSGEEWLSCEFVAGSGFLALMSRRVVIIMNLNLPSSEAASREVTSDFSAVAFVNPSSCEATCMRISAPSPVISVGTNLGTVRYLRFSHRVPPVTRAGTGEPVTSSVSLTWCEYATDVLPMVSTLAGGLRPSASQHCILAVEQYPNDPNAFVAVVEGVCGIVKYYALENRLSAYFADSETASNNNEQLVAVAITAGGGFVVGFSMPSFRVVVWNEQTGKRKDRSTPPHFECTLPCNPTAPIHFRDTVFILPRVHLFVAANDTIGMCITVPTQNTSSWSVFEVQCAPEARHVISMTELHTGAVAAAPLSLSPWLSCSNQSDLKYWIILGDDGVLRLTASQSVSSTVATQVIPLSGFVTSSRSSSRGVFAAQAAFSEPNADISCHTTLVTPILATSRPLSQRPAKMLAGNRFSMRACATGSPLLCVSPQSDTYYAARQARNSESSACGTPCSSVWQVPIPINSAHSLLVRVDIEAEADGIAVVVCLLGERPDLSPSNQVLATSRYHASSLSLLSIQDVQLVAGEWYVLDGRVVYRTQVNPRRPEVMSVVVWLSDGSFVLGNIGASTEASAPLGIHVPNALFPASDPVVGFSAWIHQTASTTAHRDPNESATMTSEPKQSFVNRLLLCLLTSKANLLLVDLSSGTPQVLTMRSLTSPAWKLPKSVDSSDASPVRFRASEQTFDAPRKVSLSSLVDAPVVANGELLSLQDVVLMPSSFSVQVRLCLSPSADVMRFGLLSPMVSDRSPHSSGIVSGSVCVKAKYGTDESSLEPQVVTLAWDIIVGGQHCTTGSFDLEGFPNVESFLSACTTTMWQLCFRFDVAGTMIVSLTDEVDSTGSASGVFFVEQVVKLEEPCAHALRSRVVGAAVGGFALTTPSQSSGTEAVATIALEPDRIPLLVMIPSVSTPQLQSPRDVILCAQVSNNCLVLYKAASVVPALPNGSPTAGSSTSTTDVTRDAHAIFTASEGETICNWCMAPVAHLSAGGAPPFAWITSHLMLVLTASSVNTLQLHCFDVTDRVSTLKSAIAVPRPVWFSLSRTTSANIVVIEPPRGNDDTLLHVYIVFTAEHLVDSAHIVISRNLTASPKPATDFFPLAMCSTSDPKFRIAAPLESQSLVSWKDWSRILPPMPKQGSATQKEQGFLKRLIVSSVDSKLDKMESTLWNKVREETYEEALERIIAPVEQRRAAASTAPTMSESEQKRRLLLGSRYEETVERERGRKGGARGDLDRTKQQMNENLELLHERGEKIEKVQTKSELLAAEAQEFASLCRQLKEKERSRWF